MDPIKKLFLDSIRQYSSESRAAGGLLDAGADYQKTVAEEVAKLQRLYGGGDLESFPEFSFPEMLFPHLSEIKFL
uniref:ATP synthase peripheral stalk subunit F6, mitochondrial n=1 Tax=Oryzias sinensis TaxID=183150 RepID=A0A8C7YCP1_9TELE